MDAVSAARAFGDPISDDALLSLGSMEGLADAPSARRVASPWPGYLAAAGVAVAAYALHYLPMAPFLVSDSRGMRRPISASIIAIVIALIGRNVLPIPAATLAGCKIIVKRVIPAAIVLTGAGLNLGQLARLGPPSLAVVALSMAMAIATAWTAGRVLGLGVRTSILIGAGTAICGNSAIVAAAPVIEADEEDVALSVGAVSLLGLLLMFLLPVAGGVFGLGEAAFGVWAGTSIHAVPQAVAAGFTYGNEAGTVATLVKLVRVTLLAPLMLLLAVWHARHWKAEGRAVGSGYSPRLSQAVPSFLWGFLFLALLATAGAVPSLEFRFASWLAGDSAPVRVSLASFLGEMGNVCLALAMAAIGLEVNLRLLARLGGRALAAGAIATVALCGTSFVLIRLLL